MLCSRRCGPLRSDQSAAAGCRAARESPGAPRRTRDRRGRVGTVSSPTARTRRAETRSPARSRCGRGPRSCACSTACSRYDSQLPSILSIRSRTGPGRLLNSAAVHAKKAAAGEDLSLGVIDHPVAERPHPRQPAWRLARRRNHLRDEHRGRRVDFASCTPPWSRNARRGRSCSFRSPGRAARSIAARALPASPARPQCPESRAASVRPW